MLTRTSCRFGQINNSFDKAFCCIDLTLFPVLYETGSIKSVFSHFFAVSISLLLSIIMLFPIKKVLFINMLLFLGALKLGTVLHFFFDLKFSMT